MTAATLIYLGSLTPDVESTDILRFFEQNGFNPDEIDVQMLKQRASYATGEIGAFVAIHGGHSFDDVVKRVGRRAEIERGRRAEVKPWTGKVHEKYIRKKDDQEEAQHRVSAVQVLERLKSKNSQIYDERSGSLEKLPQQPPMKKDYFKETISSLMEIIASNTHIIQKQATDIEYLKSRSA